MIRRDLGEIVFINNRNVVVAKFERLFNTTVEIHKNLKNRFLSTMGRKLSDSDKKDFIFQLDKFINGNLQVITSNKILLDSEGRKVYDEIVTSTMSIKNKVRNMSNIKSLFKSRKEAKIENNTERLENDIDLS